MRGGSEIDQIVINEMVCSVQWCCYHCVNNRSKRINKCRFCISEIGHMNVQMIGIGYKNKKKINIGPPLFFQTCFCCSLGW